MLKHLTTLEHKIGEKTYRFYCDLDAPITEVKEALFQFLKFAGQVEDHVKTAQAQAASQTDSQVKEEPKKEE